MLLSLRHSRLIWLLALLCSLCARSIAAFEAAVEFDSVGPLRLSS